MSEEQDKLWSAYMDGELSAAEASKFDQSLSPDERARLAAEMQFECSLSEVVRSDSPCPEALWKRVQAEIATSQTRSRERWKNVVAYALSAAAIVLFAVSAYVLNAGVDDPEFMHVAAAIDMQEKLPEVSSPDGIEDLLHRNGIALNLNMPGPQTWAPAHHSVQLLGARHTVYHEKPVVVLLFECCHQPVNVVLARRGTPAAHRIGIAVSNGAVQESRPVGIYVAAVIGNHEASDVMNFIHARSCHPSTPEE